MALREFSSVSVGDTLPEKVIPLTRQDLVNYAGVSGDLNPIHWDDEIAKQVGLDTAIAHGMLTMGLGGGYVTSWVGDPAAVTPLLALADLGSSEVDAEGEDFFVREGRLAARHRAVCHRDGGTARPHRRRSNPNSGRRPATRRAHRRR